MGRVFPFLLCALVSLLASTPAQAVPSFTTLADAVKAPLIVVAKVHGVSSSGIELDVERALRGSASGPLAVVASGSRPGSSFLPYPIGTRLIAFVGASNVWFAAATPAVGPTLEAGVLRVQGIIECCDASVVSPGTLTLEQLEAAVRGSPLAWTFRGNLVLPGPHGPTPSTIALEVHAPGSVVRGMPTMSRFPSATVDVGFGVAPDVTVSWAAGSSVRPLRLEGTATGKNPDGSIAVQFAMTQPGPMNEADLRRYLADARLSHPFYLAQVSLSDGTHMTLQLGRDPGRVGTLSTAVGEASLTGLSMAPARNIASPLGTLTLDARRAGLAVQRTGAVGELVQELMAGSVGCRFTKTGGATLSCTIDHLDVRFARSPRGPI